MSKKQKRTLAYPWCLILQIYRLQFTPFFPSNRSMSKITSFVFICIVNMRVSLKTIMAHEDYFYFKYLCGTNVYILHSANPDILT